MKIKILDKNGVVLNTENKLCKENIEIILDEKLISEGYEVKGEKISGTYNVIFVSTNNGATWLDIHTYFKNTIWLFNVKKIMIKLCSLSSGYYGIISSTKLGVNTNSSSGEKILEFDLTQDVDDIVFNVASNTGSGD